MLSLVDTYCQRGIWLIEKQKKVKVVKFISPIPKKTYFLNEVFIGHIFKGKYLDCGSMDGY